MLMRRIAAVAVLLFLPVSVHGQGQPLKQRLQSQDEAVAKAAVAEVMRKPELADPEVLVLAALQMFNFGARDDAVFWYWAGAVREDYAEPEEDSQKTGWVGVLINSYAWNDTPKLLATMQRAIDWDNRTYIAWARVRGIDPMDADFINRRKIAHDGVAEWMNRFRARAAAEPPREPGEVRAKRDYSTAAIERTVGGKTLRLPVNYVTPFGRTAPPTETVGHLNVVLFMPDLGAFTRSNWREGDIRYNKNLVLVYIKSAEVATEQPLACRAGSYYCEGSFIDPVSGLSVKTVLHPQHEQQAPRINARLRDLLKAWFVK